MMKIERDKLKRKVWEKPSINTLSFQKTLGGNAAGTEHTFYAPDAQS